MRHATYARYLTCRTLGHAWDVVPADRAGSLGGDPMWLRCQRCNTERHDSISLSTGELINRQYVYQESYQHAFDENFADAAPTRADFRRMLLIEHIHKARAARQDRKQTA